MKKRNGRSPLPMTSADPRRLEQLASTRSRRLDFVLRPATSARNKSGKSGGREDFKRMKTVIEPGNEKGVRFEKPHHTEGALRRSPPSADRCRTMSGLLPRRREPRHGHSEDSVPKTMPVRYELRRYPAEIGVLAAFKRTSRLPPAL